MLGPGASGFGWNDAEKMIIVEKEIYRQWCKSHPTAVGLYKKPFPHYDSLDTVFGKDKADGSVTEDIIDMTIEMEKENVQSTQEGGSRINLNYDDENFESQVPETPAANTTAPGSNLTNQPPRDSTNHRTGKRGGKRVKYNDDASDSMSNSLNKLGEIYANGVENMKQVFTSCFVHEKHTADRRNQIVSILKEIEGLSDAEVVMAGMLITKDNNLCDYFFTMDTPGLRKRFVDIVLSNNGSREFSDVLVSVDLKCQSFDDFAVCRCLGSHYLIDAMLFLVFFPSGQWQLLAASADRIR
ncbi:hypothetical protein MtrunA17_Chr5g0401441 [Medicago truncatula]|uniref:Myb/SANT-like domain-containing protein n=1 Tax=Medicago truncatula TaxID=3880 RepID=A0A396HKV6_MEDTR|nr:hypothetical protein MtrunA17_Chr5g0401441 [Medicago truncatula]